MSITPMPFITGPVASPTSQFRLSPPHGNLVAIVPLSKVQEVLWLDYIRRPWATHYALTLKVDFSKPNLSLENIVNHIYQLGLQHDMLRATFHTDGTAQDMSQSFMAIHDPATCVQNLEIVHDEPKLQQALRRPFDLSLEFSVRWIIHQNLAAVNGRLQATYTIYAMGHHIAVDGTSMSHLSRQLLELNSDDVSEQQPKSIPSYGEFVQRQTAYLRGEAATAAKSFWMAQVANTRPYEWTHTQTSPPPGHDYRKMNTWAFFPAEELAAWSKLYSTSWFRIATSVIGLVMAGHSKATPHHDHTLQVAFGAREAKYANCLSHMANTMPIRQPVSELMQSNGTFADLVKNVGKRISQAKRHEMFPFLSLLHAAREEGRGEYTSDKVAVTFSPKLADACCTLYPVQGVWDLFFCFLEQEDGVSLGVITDPNTFDEAAVNNLKADFMSTIRLSQASNSFKLNSLSYLEQRDVATLVKGPDVADVNAVSSSRVTDWIRERAAAQPNALALHSGEEKTSMTYRELDDVSDRKALYIQQRGVGASDVVVLHIERTFDIVSWIIAVLKAGACYIVLDKGLPLARKQAILRVAESKLFVTDLVDESFFKECATPPETLNVWAQKEFPAGRPNSAFDKSPSDLAYIIFTSGSTGVPKAIMVEHQNLSHYVSSTRNVVTIGPGSRVLQFASFAFDASILEWAVSLSYGATLCFVKYPSLVVGDYLADVVDLNEINFFHTTPSVLSSIPENRRLPSLRMLSVGGEAASAGLLDRWSKRLRMIHAYGPTETTVICSNAIMIPNPGKTPSPSNIGLANPNTGLLICPEGSDTALEHGQVGEICIVGPQVTRGYRGQAELTAEKFRTVEYNGQPARMYRSGDGGFIDSDGNLNILGRLNNREIKVRGYRIDLAAVERSILDHCPEVKMASVQVIGESLIGFAASINIDSGLIRERIAKDLPAYSVPREIIIVESLPLNSNGKVDHKQVQELLCREDSVESEVVTPVSEPVAPKAVVDVAEIAASHIAHLEATIASLWQEVLGCREIPDSEVTFYDAGGHSLLLTTLHKKLSAQYPDAGISLLDVFHHPTIRRQAEYLSPIVINSYTPTSVSSAASDNRPSTIRTQSSRSSVEGGSRSREELFAIVGMAGRFPGADSVEEMWDLLMEQRDGITTSDGSGAKDADVKEQEFFVPRYGSINGLNEFCSNDWALSEAEASKLDPQKRLFLMTAKQALDDAKIKTSKTEGANVGTFVGIAHNTFQHLDTEPESAADNFESRYRVVLDPNASTFTAFKLNLTGPSVDINTACASSLVALHQAINSLRAGDCDTALVGGVSISYPQLGGYVTSEGKIFSATGECRPLDDRADGSVPADGVAAVVLKPLSAARAAGDRVYAVVEGHAIGTDGSVDKVGFTVPSSSGQAKVVCDAIVNSGVNPQDIRYVEMHGSGTSVGDALEVQGLEKAFSSSEEMFCRGDASPVSQQPSLATRELLVGSNKGNFGNSETASGLVSLIKASLAVHKGVVPPMRQLGDMNKLINPSKTRVQPLRSHLKLNKGDHVGVTALGYGGVNAHCVIASLETVDAPSWSR